MSYNYFKPVICIGTTRFIRVRYCLVNNPRAEAAMLFA